MVILQVNRISTLPIHHALIYDGRLSAESSHTPTVTSLRLLWYFQGRVRRNPILNCTNAIVLWIGSGPCSAFVGGLTDLRVNAVKRLNACKYSATYPIQQRPFHLTIWTISVSLSCLKGTILAKINHADKILITPFVNLAPNPYGRSSVSDKICPDASSISSSLFLTVKSGGALLEDC